MPSLPEETVLAGKVAVIRRIDHDGVLQQAAALQAVQQLTDRFSFCLGQD